MPKNSQKKAGRGDDAHGKIRSVNTHRKLGSVIQISTHDLELLREYGFKERTMKREEINLKKIYVMNMRQLDRLKMLLIRNSELCGGYTKEIREGLLKNDLVVFSRAVVLLAPFIA